MIKERKSIRQTKRFLHEVKQGRVPESLYRREAGMGVFENRIITEIAGLDNVSWWHRNLSRPKGFLINGFINHYPDFILKAGSGRIIVLETKGDDRDNSDSEKKPKLGKAWAAKLGEPYRYMMVFENNPLNGAERLDEVIRKLKQLEFEDRRIAS